MQSFKSIKHTLKCAQRSFAEYILIRREKSLLINFLDLNKLNKQALILIK